MTIALAFDRASVRTYDVDGRLRVSTSHISMEQVADYLGREIPGWRALGLEERKVYKLYRPAAEMEKAKATFNSVPILTQHVPVTAVDHRPELVCGCTGSDAVFKAPYLDNSLVIWAQEAIDLIESEEQKELSCAYRYTPVLEPGTFNGQSYDIRMTDLIANHVALVAAGRAGPTVVVGDALPQELKDMSKTIPSRMALLARGALLALVPQMAADAKPDFNKTLAGVTAKNWAERKPTILAAMKPMFAQDADVGGLVKLLDSLDGEAKVGDDPTADPGAGAVVDPGQTDKDLDAVDADPCAELMAMLAGKLPPEELAAFEAKLRAAITPPAADDATGSPGAGGGSTTDPPLTAGKPPGSTATEEDMITKPAMDAAIKAAVAAATTKTIADTRRIAIEIAEAEKVVRPYVGELVAMDSAEAVYKAALEVLEIPTKDLHPSAYRAVLTAQPLPNAPSAPAPAVAMDSRAALAKTHPNVARIRVLG